MPSTVSTNQVILPQTILPEEDAINIDVTSLVKDMLANGNNGFAIGLTNETFYNGREYASSVDPNATKHPKLVIIYH